MIIGRRAFIQAAALIATTPALENLLSLSLTAQSDASLLPSPLPQQLAADGTDMNCVIFKIHGWDLCEDAAVCGATMASADLVTNDSARESVFIRINRSWRTAWR